VSALSDAVRGDGRAQMRVTPPQFSVRRSVAGTMCGRW
jgi:hypothetical protein